MKLAEFLLIVGCVAVAKSASQSESNEATVSGPHSGSSELVPLSLFTFQNIYLIYVENMGPIYNNTCNDFQNQVDEFQYVNLGIQEFLSLSGLYSQYLPVHTICRQQINLVIDGLSTIAADKNGYANVLLAPADLTAFGEATHLIAAGDTMVIEGAMQTITAIQNAVASPDFQINHGNFELPGDMAVAIGNGIATIMAGNQKIADGFTAALNINLEVTISNQDNIHSSNFLQALFDFLSAELNGFVTMKTQEDLVYNIFASASKSETFTVDITTLNDAVDQAYYNIGTVFDEAADACSTFENAIVSASE